MSDLSPDSLERLRKALSEFAAERDWARFHSPKNLVMALSGETGELIEHFQWLSEEASRSLTSEQVGEVELEMADVLLYLVRLADVLGIDLVAAAERKIRLNAERYPVEKFRGLATKYSRL